MQTNPQFNTKKILFYFAAVNLLLIIFLATTVISERVNELQTLHARISVQERRLAQFKENLNSLEINKELLANLQQNRGGIAHYSGDIGTSLAVVQELFAEHNLRLGEFFTREQTTHEVYGYLLLETRATIAGDGTFDNIMAFLHSLVEQDYYYRIERVQVNDIDTGWASISLEFSIYSF